MQSVRAAVGSADAAAPERSVAAPDDDELDAFIRTRLRLLGIDLSVLPEDDADAPTDQRRVLASARNLLRNTVPVISGFAIDVQDVPPVLYPARLPESR